MYHRMTRLLTMALIAFGASSIQAAAPASKRAVDILTSPEDDIRRYYENTRQLAPKPSREVIGRIVARAKERPEDPEALYWAAQAGLDGLSDQVPDFMQMMRKSAEKGFPPAMASYGIELCGGAHVPRDVPAGMKLLTQARDKGDPGAFYQLGLVYFLGADGIPRNLDRAEDLFKIAVDKGVAHGLVALTKLYGAKNDTRHFMEYAEKAADAGSSEMIALLAQSYAGKGPLPLNDPPKAIEWARKGALLDDPASLRVYAYLLDSGFPGLKRDMPLARRLLQRAADLGDNEAAAALQAGRVIGLFGERQPKEGLEALEKLVAAGIVEAKWHLGRVLYGGQGETIQTDKKRALGLIREAAKEGYMPAQHFLTALEKQPEQ
jgi:TPR repeat protein